MQVQTPQLVLAEYHTLAYLIKTYIFTVDDWDKRILRKMIIRFVAPFLTN